MSDGWETADSGWETANDGWETADVGTGKKSFLDLASTIPFALAKQAQGVKQAAGDFFGNEEWSQSAAQARQQIEEEEKKVNPQFEGLGGMAYGGVKSTLQAIPALGAGAINPALGMGMIAGGSGAEAYGKYRERGATPGEAATGGILEGTIEGATEALPLGFILKRMGKEGFLNFIKGLAVREGLGEQIATLGQDAVDTAIANPNKTWQQYLEERPKAALETAIATGVQVGLMGGASAAGRRLTPPTLNAQEVKDALDELDKQKELQKQTQGEGTLYVDKAGDVTSELPRRIQETPEQLDLARTELQKQLEEKATRNVEGQQLELFDETGRTVERQQELDLTPKPEGLEGAQAAPDASSLVGPDTPPSKVAPWKDFLSFLADRQVENPKLDALTAIKRQMDMRSRIFDDNSLNTDLPRNIIKPDGSVDVRDLIRAVSENEYISTVRKDLVGLLEDLGPYIENVRINFLDAKDVDAGRGKKVPAFYTAVDHAITSGNQGWNARVMLHELVHAATVRAIVAHTEVSGALKQHAPQAIKDLNTILEHVRNKSQKVGKDYYLEGGRMYGLENIKEFASEVMTNRYLQKILNDMSAKELGLTYKETSVLKSFFKAVGRLFGVKDPNVDSLLKHSMSLIGDITKYQKENTGEVEKLLKKYNPTSSQKMRSLIAAMGDNPDRPDVTKAVKISTPEETKAKQIEEVSGEIYISANPKIDEKLVNKIKEEKDGSNVWALTPGALARSELANSTLVKTVYQLMNNAYKRSEYQITKVLKPTQDTFIPILRNEQKAAISHDLLMREMKKGQDYSAEELRNAGIPDDIIYAHVQFRAMMQQALEAQNRVRRDMGLPPITELQSYISSRWSGPWRVNIKDAEGNIIWQVAEHSKKKAQDAIEWIKAKEPNLKFDDPTYRKGFEKADTIEAGYLDMLKMLDPNDTRIPVLESIYKDYLLSNTEDVNSQEKHFLRKKGVRGFSGDRTWSKNDVRDFFEQQFAYTENAFRWAEAQDSIRSVKELLNNPDLQESQKNNIAYSKEYVKSQLGYGTSDAFAAIDNGLAKMLGTSPQELQKYMGAAKTWFYLSKLGLSVPFTITQLLQPAITTPAWHSHLDASGYKHNPVQTTFKAIYGGAQAALWHYGSFFNMPELKQAAEKTMSKLDIEAAKYMEANEILDINPMTDIKKGLRPAAVNAVAAPFEFTIKHSEMWARSNAFMGFVDHLKQSGKYDLKTHEGRLELFQKAEDMTNLSMTDYRSQERGLLFERGGLTGDAAATLHTYQINNLMQLVKFGKEAADGNPRPLFMMVAMQASAAGLLGLWFIDDLDDLLENLKKLLPHEEYIKVKDFNLRNWLIKNTPDLLAYGGVSKITGTNIHTRLNASDQIPDPSGVVPFAEDIFKSGMGLFDVANPNSSPKEKWAGAYATAPTVAKGPMENLPAFESNGVSLNPKDLKEGRFKRTEEEKSLRNYGFRSLREQKQLDTEYGLSKIERQLQNRMQSASSKSLDYFTSGRPKEAVEQLIKYNQLGGDPETILNQIPKAKIAEVTTELERRAIAAQGQTKSSILKMQRYLEQVQR